MKLQEQPGASLSPGEEPTAKQRVEEQQRYVDSLRQEIHSGQRRAERDLEREQAHLRQQQSESKYSTSTVSYLDKGYYYFSHEKKTYFHNAKAKVLRRLVNVGHCRCKRFLLTSDFDFL